MRQYLPHTQKVAPSKFHIDFAEILSSLTTQRGRKIGIEAPRGSAKSTLASRGGYPLYCALEGKEEYILILADTGPQAELYLDGIKSEIEGNERIRQDYPRACGKPIRWQSSKIQLSNGVMIEALGTGSKIRGRAKGSSRPTLVIGDDLNRKEDAYSATLRERKYSWFTDDLLRIGDQHTNFVIVGTPIHREVISHRIRKLPGWETWRYRSLLRYPDRMDLWKEWEMLATNLADDDRNLTAQSFYESNRADMEAGAELLWPEWKPLYDLMSFRAQAGIDAFNSEEQGEPGSGGISEWPADYFRDEDILFTEFPESYIRVQSLDPSKGQGTQPGDWQAHIDLRLARDGTLWVDADLRRESTTNMVRRCVELLQFNKPHLVVIENNGTMGMLKEEFVRQLGNYPFQGDIEHITHTEPKWARILSLGPYFSQRRIKVRNTPGGQELLNQLRSWPTADHDDGPDALATALRRLEIALGVRQ